MRSETIHLTPSEAAARTGLVLDGVGWITEQQRRQTALRPNYAGLLLTAGRGTLEREGHPEPYPLEPGTVWWLPPGAWHSYGPDSAGWSERWILFHGLATTAYEELGLLAGGPVTVPIENPSQLIASMHQLTALARRPDALSRDLAAGAELHRFIQLVHTTYHVPDDIGQAAVDFLIEHAFGPVAIVEVAKKLNVSHDTLVAKVKALTGSTPSDFLIRRRLAHAKELLTATTMPVARIARLVGYQDPGYFTRLFTERTGVPPTEFRRVESRDGEPS
jgi:AraC-like DNA-binding protein